MTPRRHDDDLDPISEAYRPTANLARLTWLVGGAVVSLLVGAYFLDHRLATAAAAEIVEARVGPVERRIDDHLAQSRAMREVMDRYVIEEREQRRLLTRKLDALCRASSRPQVCLGED